jgi:hypothetical protein
MKVLSGQMSFHGEPKISKRLNEEQSFLLRRLIMQHPRPMQLSEVAATVEREDVNGFIRRLRERGLVVREGTHVRVNPSVLREDW